MSWYNKVVWSEGMFLRPQHFQQQDRYTENLVRAGLSLRPHAWGFDELAIDTDLLETGKLAIARCSGIMPDGTCFRVPDEADPPTPLDLDTEIKDSQVFLALPVRQARGIEADLEGLSQDGLRYAVAESEVRDTTSAGDNPAHIQVGRLRFRLMREEEERGGFHCLGLARVVEVSPDGSVLMDGDFMPSCIDFRVAAKLTGFFRELEGLLHQRGESLAGRVSESGRGSAAEIADFLLLQAVNRYEPLVAHLSNTAGVHPEAAYRLLLEMAGEFATFATAEKRAPAFSAYRHDALKETFEPVISSLRRSLSMVFERAAIAIPLVERRYGIRVAEIADRSLLQSAMFVLAVRADMPDEALRRSFPAKAKVGTVEKIRDLVNHALPGIAVQPLPVAPRQIPFHTGVVYFSLDTKDRLWRELEKSGGLALHVGGKFPGLAIDFWAIRQSSS